MDVYLRPYPLSVEYSDIYNLNENTPKWFLEIALNFCNAWIAFLYEAIENNDFYVGADSDYADLNWTTKHCNMLVELVKKLEGLIGDQNGN